MNELIIKLQENNIESTSAKTLEDTFLPYFKQAQEWKEKASSIVVIDENSIQEMKLAREARLAFKNIRCNVEKARKAKKDESLRYGKAVDGLANVIKFLITPLEQESEEKEKFVERKREAILEEMEDDRKEALLKYEVDIELYDLRIISEDKYQILLENSKDLFERKKVIEQAEAEAEIKYQEEERIENERIRKENELLKKEAEERDRAAKLEVEKQGKIEVSRKLKEEAEQKIRDEKAAKEKAEYEKKIEAERQEKERVLKIEKDKQVKIEAELKAIEDAEQKKIKEEQERIFKEKEAEKQKELAPDKVKLNELAIYISSITMPTVKSEEAQEIIVNTVELLNKTSNYIKSNVIKI